MQAGAITGYIDVAQLTLYAFWAFFAGIVYYCHREDKREGYPLITDRKDRRVDVQGFPPIPPIKYYKTHENDGLRDHRPDERALPAMPTAKFFGAPLQPTGNPMIDGVGPASWAQRADEPDLGFDDRKPKIVPLRVATDFWVATEDPDPRGMPVYAADRQMAGIVTDVWVDRSETIIRYLEVEVPTASGARRVLVPMPLIRVSAGMRPRVNVASITAAQFADAPVLRNPDQITLLEEDKVSAYFGSGHLYAKPGRFGPLL